MIVQPAREGFGVEILDIDLSKPIAKADVQAIQDLYNQVGLLIFRDQKLTKQGLVDATEATLGKTQVHVVEGSIDVEVPKIFTISLKGKRADLSYEDGEALVGWQGWHSDLCYTPRPCRGAMMYAIEVPPQGGQTGFVDTIAAYTTLSPQLKQRIEGLHVIHSWRYLLTIPAIAASPVFQTKDGSRHPDLDKFPDLIYPLVMTHPVTGAKVLNSVPSFATDIVEMPNDEGRALLDGLIGHLLAGPRVYWHTYRPGDVVAWDNWRTNHAGSGTKAKYRRLLWRTTIEGTVDFGRYLDPGMAQSTRVCTLDTDSWVPPGHDGKPIGLEKVRVNAS